MPFSFPRPRPRVIAGRPPLPLLRTVGVLGSVAALAVMGIVVASSEGSADMRVTDITVRGPAWGQDSASPNRLGSQEVPVRVYEPETEPWATLVWAHGGSFVRGTLDWPEADWVSQRFADAGVRVYSVDYVLASDEVKAPAPANDVAAVLREVSAEAVGPVVVGGASAGANLAVQAALLQVDGSDRRLPDSQGGGSGARVDAVILQYPTFHRAQRYDETIAALTASLPEQRRFDAVRISDMYDYYLGDDVEGATSEAQASGRPAADGGPVSSGGAVVVGELPAERLQKLPPVVMVNAEADDLRASGEQFAEQLREAGVSVSLAVEPGTVHGYLNRPQESSENRQAAQRTIDRFVTQLRALLPPDS